MGIATVGLAYDLVRRRFGRAAGFAAGLVLALTPIRRGLAPQQPRRAARALLHAPRCGSPCAGLRTAGPAGSCCRASCVGLGFEAKMAVALMVVPGIVAAWLWVAPRGRCAAVRQLLAGGAAMTVVGFAWPVLVGLTPAADRPWVSGTSDNSSGR